MIIQILLREHSRLNRKISFRSRCQRLLSRHIQANRSHRLYSFLALYQAEITQWNTSNTNVGTAIIIVKGTGNYAGEATIRFNIKSAPVTKPSTPVVKPTTPKPATPTPVVEKPVTVKGTTLSSVKNTKTRKMTVKWKKNKAVNGYQIQYSTNKKFTSGSKTVTVNKNSTVSKTVKKLKKGKKYYVRIRTYKTVNGKKYYSSWSKAKSVKIKK